ncbi:hypothetical protein NOR_03037 [Metarhizium rileyi]|uniref:Cis-Golgi transport protein particle complex subunit n=1 Tax=Metarhizium rileyi (strain RCEF 4871) TaxID=1649241 RepID=A0A167G8F0_METRR|nr:hypothetical protein NOR_03037 [Metarhizium rileyi RCEF 4871]TWU78912.1 hypothetical protein ED733_007882 [Metarhizium rileyi]
MSPALHGSLEMTTSEPVFDTYPGRVLPDSAPEISGEPLHEIIQAFIPTVSVYASEDTEALIEEKGLRYGLWELLRPFGEKIQGKVAVRDSQGVSRAFENFSVRFTQFGENVQHPCPAFLNSQQSSVNADPKSAQESVERDKTALAEIESVVDRHLSFAENSISRPLPPISDALRQSLDHDSVSPYYSLYLRRLLSGTPVTPHETFGHPVACVIAISSRNDAPIEELRKLYSESNQGSKRLPPWVDNDYLRYYVLVHDEENDDITRSMGFFEQMKRHLGLHCHLLRLRSSKSAETDDDSIPLPYSDWMPAQEELARIHRSEDGDHLEDPTQYIFESDATAVRTFVREMVTQSIIPTMERHISVWNDQVASRRRGIAGRFMNLSRKWTGFGGSSRSSSGGNINSRDIYDHSGYYRADSTEAIMRKLADFAFMLRDWKLARSTYELLRFDFSESKAWKYHAAANEMAALSLLIAPQNLASKIRTDFVDQMLEAAFYSYNTRCSAPLGAVRCLLLGLELLRARGGVNIDDASRWGLRLLEAKIMGPVGDALLKERLCTCYSSKIGIGSLSWGSRRRKAAIWSILAAQAWNQQGKHLPARKCLTVCRKIYDNMPHNKGIAQFQPAEEYIHSLELEVFEQLALHGAARLNNGRGGGSPIIDVENQAFANLPSKRTSAVLKTELLETAPLRGEMRVD